MLALVLCRWLRSWLQILLWVSWVRYWTSGYLWIAHLGFMARKLSGTPQVRSREHSESCISWTLVGLAQRRYLEGKKSRPSSKHQILSP